MKKINCSNCGTLNFEKVTACYNCRKAVLQKNNLIGQSTKGKVKSRKKTKLFDLKKVSKIILNIFLLAGLGTGLYFGYQKYSDWAEEQRQIQIAKKEEQEMASFSEVSFEVDKYKYDRVDKYSFGEKVMQLPKRFRMEPPELMILNSFRFDEKTKSKIGPKSVRPSLVQRYNSGTKGFETTSIEKFSDPQAYQMSKIIQQFSVWKI